MYAIRESAIPLSSDGRRRPRADPSTVVVENIKVIAMLVAAVSGWAVIRVGRRMVFEGVGVQDGGGYSALLMAAVMINLGAVSVALS
jgi:hypothetical protein